MAEVTQNQLALPGPVSTAEQIKENPWFRQAAALVGVAASVALGVALVMWMQAPSYSPLYGQLAEKDTMEVMAALEQTGTDFQVDQTTGAILVPTAKIKELRMQLASQGLPQSDGVGFELLQQETSFGTSQMVEKARYHHALEIELARTIGTIGAVQNARVHLALPKESVFVRRAKPASASVTVKLYAGRKLTAAQVEAIVHLVAASVPALESDKVTVVDQRGNLLSDSRNNPNIKLSASQFEYTQKVEAHYRDRIEDLLTPILGADHVRATVTADLDFTVTELTKEQFNPDQPALRSEKVDEEQSRLSAIQGVPGALSNQPPAATEAPENAQDGAEGEGDPINSSRRATRNYELDRVVSHSRQAPAKLKRMSVAIVVDDFISVKPDGSIDRRERTPEELERIRLLVRDAIGFDATRGDRIKVMNSAFVAPDTLEDVPELAFYEQPWFWDVVKQLAAVLVALVIVFTVLRPTMRNMTATVVDEEDEADEAKAKALADGADGRRGAGGAGGLAGEGLVDENGEELMLDSDGEPIKLPGPGGYENVLEAARQLVDEDPKRVAQLVKSWIAEDAPAQAH